MFFPFYKHLYFLYDLTHVHYKKNISALNYVCFFLHISDEKIKVLFYIHTHTQNLFD